MAVLIDQDKARAQRASEIEEALASVRLEGLEPSPEGLAIFQRYVDGELSSDQFDAACEEYLDRAYGPVRLPRHEYP
jgi:hypothetical protein